LIIPAASARRFATSPEGMVLLAIVFGVLAVVSGLGLSVFWDTPSGPSIVVAAVLFFFLSRTRLNN
ncbi:MAG: metal ABC transporter permease, partial [Gammaproteobacteria bacterium]|nr:metal ABC transporter permease [Gammaproteobacteria bacterium]